MKSKVKQSLDSFFTSQQLPSQQSIARMRSYEKKRNNRRLLPLYASVALVLVGCLLWLVYSPTQDRVTTAYVANVEETLQHFMTAEQIRHYTVIYEEEEALHLLLLDGHPLSKEDIRKLKQLPIQVETQFVWPRFPVVGIVIVWVVLVSALLTFLRSRRHKRLKAYTPLILTLFTMGYAGLGIYISEGYSGIAFVLFLMLVAPLLLVVSIFLALKWEYTQKKAQNE